MWAAGYRGPEFGSEVQAGDRNWREWSASEEQVTRFGMDELTQKVRTTYPMWCEDELGSCSYQQGDLTAWRGL